MRIDQMSRSQIAELQAQLTELGYGDLIADGVWGPKTAQAYQSYLATMPISTPVAPPADKPWWTSSALIGGLVSVAAWGASFAGFEFDVDSAKQAIPELIGAVFAVLAVVGTWRRKAPIDPTLVLPGVRIASPWLRHHPVQTSASRPAEPHVADVDRARGSFGDHS